jgi:hypothetical protein
MFEEQIYTSIPASLTASNLNDLLQSFPSLGYVVVYRAGECAQYSYTIRWLSIGDQPLISVVNSTGLTPIRTFVNVSLIQQGSEPDLFFNLPNDMMRTYHQQPQVSFYIYVFDN